MKKLSFKNRIASNYILTTALLIFVVFYTIFSIVKQSIYRHVDLDLSKEVELHLAEIGIQDHNFYMLHKEEWEEREHNTVDVNPVFIQFIDSKKFILGKSPNLKKHQLFFNKKAENLIPFDSHLLKNKIRQIQVPILEHGQIVGYIIIAMSLEEAVLVLDNLSKTLWIAFPLILLFLFLIARYMAGKSIKPINEIINTSNAITKDNLDSRIPLPHTKDELYVLSKTINQLLDRIETTIEREKKFTSDASHELRTPLTVIKGTLEVLIRKPREQKEYQEKINYCIREVNRLNLLVDQLLLLARNDYQNQSLHKEKFPIKGLIQEVVARYDNLITHKNICIYTPLEKDYYLNTDRYLLFMIVNNLISNAIKFTPDNSEINIAVFQQSDQLKLEVSDKGIGIPSEALGKVLQPFYRTQSAADLKINGIGLGLSIVKRYCERLNIKLEVRSEENEGTSVCLIFPIFFNALRDS